MPPMRAPMVAETTHEPWRDALRRVPDYKWEDTEVFPPGVQRFISPMRAHSRRVLPSRNHDEQTNYFHATCNSRVLISSF